MATARSKVVPVGGYREQEARDADVQIVSGTVQNGSGSLTVNSAATSVVAAVAGVAKLTVGSALITCSVPLQATLDALSDITALEETSAANIQPVGSANSAGTSAKAAKADHVHQGTVLQVVSARVSSDQTTTSGTPVDITGASITFTKISASSTVRVIATFAISNSSSLGATTTVRIVENSTTRDGTAQTTPALANSTQGGAIQQVLSGLAAGSQTVKLQWFNTAGTSRIRPVTALGAEHCSLIIEELR